MSPADQTQQSRFNSPKSVSLLAAGGGDQTRRQVAEARAEALQVGIDYLERHGIGVRRDHNGTDRHHVQGGLVAVAFEHRQSRAGDPQFHTHVLVQNAAHGPDGRWTALDSDRLYAHLMTADHLYLTAERAALTERLGVRWGPAASRRPAPRPSPPERPRTMVSPSRASTSGGRGSWRSRGWVSASSPRSAAVSGADRPPSRRSAGCWGSWPARVG